MSGELCAEQQHLGTYSVVFSLPGFSTLRREGVELPSNFTATINGDLKVGALEENVTVTGAAPVVDVQNVQRAQVLNREMLDAVPTARNYSGLAALMPGVRMSNTDVGGNQQAEQIYMTVNGSRQTDVTLQVDGLKMNSIMSDGPVQGYFSDAAQQEMASSSGSTRASGGRSSSAAGRSLLPLKLPMCLRAAMTPRLVHSAGWDEGVRVVWPGRLAAGSPRLQANGGGGIGDPGATVASMPCRAHETVL